MAEPFTFDFGDEYPVRIEVALWVANEVNGGLGARVRWLHPPATPHARDVPVPGDARREVIGRQEARVNAGQLTLDVRVQPPDDFADLDVRRAERFVVDELRRELAAALRPRACRCSRPQRYVDDGDVRCHSCGRATA